MRNFRRRHDWTVLRLFWAVQWLLPLVSIVLFKRCFGYGWREVFTHLFLVETAYGALLGLTLALGAVRTVRRWRVARYALPVAWSALTVALYFLYLLAWGGRLSNGMNLRFS